MGADAVVAGGTYLTSGTREPARAGAREHAPMVRERGCTNARVRAGRGVHKWDPPVSGRRRTLGRLAGPD
jgi:hypothetical protein